MRATGWWMVLLGACVMAVALSSCASTSPSSSGAPTSNGRTTTSSPIPSATASGPAAQGSGLAGFAACQSDYKVVQIALDAYRAETGNYPEPPAPWSAGTYGQDYSPLTGASNGGPFLQAPPSTTHEVIEYDSSGHIWIEPPGRYTAAYDPPRAASDPVCALVGG